MKNITFKSITIATALLVGSSAFASSEDVCSYVHLYGKGVEFKHEAEKLFRTRDYVDTVREIKESYDSYVAEFGDKVPLSIQIQQTDFEDSFNIVRVGYNISLKELSEKMHKYDVACDADFQKTIKLPEIYK